MNEVYLHLTDIDLDCRHPLILGAAWKQRSKYELVGAEDRLVQGSGPRLPSERAGAISLRALPLSPDSAPGAGGALIVSSRSSQPTSRITARRQAYFALNLCQPRPADGLLRAPTLAFAESV